VNAVVSDEQLMSEALSVAERLANGPTHAFGRTKRLISSSLGAFESQMVLEAETIAVSAGSPEGLEGISAFLDKRRPDFH
jgi:2-(1,2-epoxy-1,2-dihydrophenyl)acetyl-CoA isomerase